METQFESLLIIHNHGSLLLRDVTLEAYQRDDFGYCEHRRGVHFRTWHTATGTVVRGSTTSRLFHATSTKHDTPGEIKTVDLYGRADRIHYRGEQATIDMCFCG